MTALAIRSRIDAVTVYNSCARVTRAAVLEHESAGPVAARISGLPLALHDESVSVRLEALERASDGAPAPLPVASQVRVVLEVPPRDETLAPATPDELRAARRRESRLQGRLILLERELKRLHTLAIAARPSGPDGKLPAKSPVAARLALVEFRAERERRARAELAQARRDLETATRELEALEERAARRSTARQAQEHELRKAVEITLAGGAAAPVRARLLLDYTVPGARWAPAYAARLSGELDRADIAMRANIAQATGEDWDGAKLTLCTADPMRRTDLPELASIRIGRRQPLPPQVGWRPPPAGVDDLYRDFDACFGEPATAARADEIGAGAEPDDRARANFDDVDEEAEAAPSPDDSLVGLEAMDYCAPEEAMESYAPPAAMPAPAFAAGASSMAPARAMRKMRAPMPPSPPPEETNPTLDADHALLAYGDLRMPLSSDRARGRLTITARKLTYVETLVEQKLEITFDPITAIYRASERARTVAHLSLPRGCSTDWPEEYDYAYPARDRADIPSDGCFHSIPVAGGEARAKPVYVVVPRESTDVFRQVKAENPIDAPLLRGPVDLYWCGDFLLTSELSFTPPGAELCLGLGVEQAIKVSRNTSFREESAGLMGGSVALRHHIVVEAVNHTDRAVDLEVRERIPVVREEEDDVSVAIRAVTPDWQRFEPFPSAATEDPLRGGYRWCVALTPGERSDMRADYDVRISAKHELVGGNRREA